MAESIRFDDKYVDPSGIGSADRQGLFNLIYPVGSIYMSVNSTSPATLFGGTWEQIKDRFLLASGSSYSAGATGGEATHTLTVQEMPSHSHMYRLFSPASTLENSTNDTKYGKPAAAIGSAASSGAYNCGYGGSSNETHIYTTGGSAAHNNMPPYLAVYIWKRTA